MNIHHIWRELKAWAHAMCVNLPRLLTINPLKFLHAVMNLITETVRAVPYTLAHVAVIAAIVYVAFGFNLAEHFRHIHTGAMHVFIVK